MIPVSLSGKKGHAPADEAGSGRFLENDLKTCSMTFSFQICY